ncbi:MAG TPA: GAF domain-containing protein [Candidatus Angelobacter sp.]|nr:GAF domain-containing protein [Candidatus Angelobacter sp.]
MKTKRIDPRKLVKQIERVLAHTPAPGKDSPLEQLAELLYRQRGYSSLGIYAVVEKKTSGLAYVLLAYRGPVLPCLEVAMGKGNMDTVVQSGHMFLSQLQLQFDGAGSRLHGEMAVPIKLAGRVRGVIDVEKEGATGLAYHDQVLLKQVARLVARYLSSNGKVVIQKLHMQIRTADQGRVVDPSNKKPGPAADKLASAAKASSHKTTAGGMLRA